MNHPTVERKRERERTVANELGYHDNAAGRARNRNIHNLFLLRLAHVAQSCLSSEKK